MQSSRPYYFTTSPRSVTTKKVLNKFEFLMRNGIRQNVALIQSRVVEGAPVPDVGDRLPLRGLSQHYLGIQLVPPKQRQRANRCLKTVNI